MFEIRRAEVELPAIVALFRLETNGGRLARQGGFVITPSQEVAIHGAQLEQAWINFDETFRGLDAEFLQQPDRFAGR